MFKNLFKFSKKEVKRDNSASVRYTKQSLFFNKEYNVDLEKAPKMYTLYDRLMPDKLLKEQRVHFHPRASFIILCGLIVICSFFLFPMIIDQINPSTPELVGPRYDKNYVPEASTIVSRQGPPCYEQFLPKTRKPEVEEQPVLTEEIPEEIPATEPAPAESNETIDLQIGGVDYSFPAEKLPGYHCLTDDKNLSSIPIPKPTEKPENPSREIELNIHGKDYSFTIKSFADLFSKDAAADEDEEKANEN